MRSFGAWRRNSSFTFSVSKQTKPSLSFTRRRTSSRGGRSSFAQYSTSQVASRTWRASSNNWWVAYTFGFAMHILLEFSPPYTSTAHVAGGRHCQRAAGITIVGTPRYLAAGPHEPCSHPRTENASWTRQRALAKRRSDAV